MNVLFIASTLKEADKMKGKIHDIKFSKITSTAPDAKAPVKENHAIVVYIPNEDAYAKISDAKLFDQFSKNVIKVVFGLKSESIDDLEIQGWKYFEESKIDDIKAYIKDTFD